MKKFFAALSALAIMSLVAVGCKGKDPKPNPDPNPQKTATITVKKGGKDVTNLELSVGDKVAISTNAASAPEGLIVNSSTGAFEVKADPAGIVEVSKTEIVAKAAGEAKVIFSAGEAKVEVAVKVKKTEEAKFDPKNFLGNELYVPQRKFSDMKNWKAELVNAYGSNGWNFTAYKDDPDSKTAFLFLPNDGTQSVFGAVGYYHNPQSGPTFIIASAGFKLGFWSKEKQEKILTAFGFTADQQLDGKLKDGTPAASGVNQDRGLDGLLYMQKKKSPQGEEYEHLILQVTEVENAPSSSLHTRAAFKVLRK